ncbi:MAG: pilus assembly protein PilP [Gammaproteobacteria bacterium]|nr:pilus assembly protein PilP [Gammaproteobacteria bacterium]
MFLGIFIVSDYRFLKPKRAEWSVQQENKAHLVAIKDALPPSITLWQEERQFKKREEIYRLLRKDVLISPEEAPYLLDILLDEGAQVDSFELQEPQLSLEENRLIPFSLSFTSACHPFKKCLQQFTQLASRFPVQNFIVRNEMKEKAWFQAEGSLYTTASKDEPLRLARHERLGQKRSGDTRPLNIFRLVGVLKNDDKTWALISRSPNAQIEKLTVGQMLPETSFKVAEITRNRVELSKGQDRFQLVLSP